MSVRAMVEGVGRRGRDVRRTRAGGPPVGVRRPGGGALGQRVGAWRRRMRQGCRDAGMATAEYAMVTLAAVGFAGLLALVLRSDEVRGLLTDLVHRALG